MKNGRLAKITIELTIYPDRVEGVATGTKWTGEHSGKSIKTTPYATHYGSDALSIYYKVLKQAMLEATEPQIDFALESLGLPED